VVSSAIDLAEVSDRTLFGAFKDFARYNPAVTVREDGPMLLVRTGIHVSFFNCAFVRGPVADPVAFVEEAKAFFEERSLPWRICGRVGIAEEVGLAALAAGLRAGTPMEGMTLHPLDGLTPMIPPGVEIEMVEDEDGLAVNQEIAASGFGMPVEMSRAILPPAVLGSPDLAAFTARVDGVPAAVSVLIKTDEVAGIYNVGTSPDFRRRGLGAAMTAAALAEGARRGCTVGALQPSVMGRPVYAKMRFQPSALYLEFATPPATP
jgi:ribosomal protein S18 acetylase RimI-like enzyme